MLYNNATSVFKEGENPSLSRDAKMDVDNETIHVIVRQSSASSFSQGFNSVASSQRFQNSNSLHLVPVMTLIHSDLDMAYKSDHSSRNLQCPMDSSYTITGETVSDKTVPICQSEGIFSNGSLTINLGTIPPNAVQLRKMQASPSATNYHPELEDGCSKEFHKFVSSCESSLTSEGKYISESLFKTLCHSNYWWDCLQLIFYN